MTEWTKTLTFVAAAAASLGLAAGAAVLTRPSTPKQFERVGEEFYAEFKDPLAARTLKVVSYDEDTSVIKNFDVTWGKDGWTISPYGYPADAKDQLKKTAASLVGIERTGLASRREADEEIYGVIDPLSEDATKLKGRGSRVILKDEKDQTLADYILGKPVEGRDGYFYVRKPKEKETYIAKVDLNLSTRFADWIESDLLQLAAADLRNIEIRKYTVDIDRGTMTAPDLSVLSRDDDFGPWKLDGLNEAAEQVNTAEVNKITRVLDDLKVIGVRPKPQGLNPDLSLDPEVINNEISLRLLRNSLDDKGFFLARGDGDSLQLVGKEGQLSATTGGGVAYDVYFGEQFTGSLFDVEFGDAQDADKPKRLKQGEAKETEKGRYVFITARFDPARLGEAPTPPADPQPLPADAGEAEKKKAEESAKAAQDVYESAKKTHEQKIVDAKKKVDDLNDRFKKWYYVISAESFQDLRLSREALVQPKTPASPTPGADAAEPTAPASPAEPEVPAEARKPTAAESDVAPVGDAPGPTDPAAPRDTASPAAEPSPAPETPDDPAAAESPGAEATPAGDPPG